jgi:hypothetical protein
MRSSQSDAGWYVEWREPAPLPIRPPQIPCDMTRERTQAAAAGRRPLTI